MDNIYLPQPRNYAPYQVACEAFDALEVLCKIFGLKFIREETKSFIYGTIENGCSRIYVTYNKFYQYFE